MSNYGIPRIRSSRNRQRLKALIGKYCKLILSMEKKMKDEKERGGEAGILGKKESSSKFIGVESLFVSSYTLLPSATISTRVLASINEAMSTAGIFSHINRTTKKCYIFVPYA